MGGRGENGSLVSLEVFKLLNLLRRFLQNEAWLLLRIVLTLKGADTDSSYQRRSHLLSGREQASLKIYKSCPKQHYALRVKFPTFQICF